MFIELKTANEIQGNCILTGVSSWVRALVEVAVASNFATEWSESATITLDDCGTFVSSSTHLDSAASHSTIDWFLGRTNFIRKVMLI